MEETSQEDHGEEALSSRSEEEEQAREGMFKILTKLEIDSAYQRKAAEPACSTYAPFGLG